MLWVLVAVVVVLLVIVAALLVREQRSRRLRKGFGPEYKRVVAEHGDQRAAEQELIERRERLDQFQIRPLEPTVRANYVRRWETTQRRFVDEPVAAVGEAHGLVQEVMHDRGYPVADDFDQRAADLSVDHAELVENYRAAHGIAVRAHNGQASTEQLRRSMVHFRALFDDLLAPTDNTRPGEGDQSVASSAPTRGGN